MSPVDRIAPAAVAQSGAGLQPPPAVRSRRSALRAQRHPNAVTAPPLHRGSMTPVPWRGFWNSLGMALL
ncbi:glucans biosynthesis glucosyltransferase MdoH, partial [Verminephrobacter aporrectodeae subsp. tuberculatae]|nr:glucans biosynthesis glucosyltransferase MdoH [Verminephrobacter aporrectodeae subsp. tuberculatae]